METYSLQDGLSALRPEIRTPKRQLFVCVIDDKPEQVADIETILRAWPGLSIAVIKPDQITATADIIMVDEKGPGEQETSQTASSFDIWLVDEFLGEGLMSGGQLVEILRRQAPQALFASIKGMDPSEWATEEGLHFGFKSKVGGSHGLAMAFVKFMNGLITRIESAEK